MLNPFKSFLKNLQNNAEQLFGAKASATDMNPNPEEEEEIAADSIYNIDDIGPLDDPLALDDEYDGRAFENSGSAYESTNTTLSELDSSDDGRIILVDVNSLKNSFSAPATSGYSSATRSKTKTGSGGGGGQPNSGAAKPYDPIGLPLDDETADEVEGARSDGSDSGLGLEICSNLLSEPATTTSANALTTTKSNLKRRSDPNDMADAVDSKKPKRNIQFSGVTVFYFPRIQGFTCVPSQGGCTLGMAPDHCDEKSFTLAEHTAEQKRLHRLQMLDRSPTPSTSAVIGSALSTLVAGAPSTSAAGEVVHATTAAPLPTATTSTGDDRSRSSTEESDTDEEILSDNSGSDVDTESIGFLQPVSQKHRRALLKAAGIRDIVSIEKNECRDIRASREMCGCRCRDYCDPESCFCSRSGIKCQVDRPNFPCGCTENGCGNAYGRVEFNPKRVRTHFIHTIMRLELEKKQKKTDKQNTLHTYDGRLRLPDTEQNGDAVDAANVHDPSNKANQLPLYNGTSNAVYPPAPAVAAAAAATVLHSTNIRHISAAPHNQFDDTSRTIGSPMARPALDLHYAYRQDYAIDIAPAPALDAAQSSYPLLYTNTAYYRHPCGASFDDYLAMSSPPAEQTPAALAYPPYDGLANNNCETAPGTDATNASSDLTTPTPTPMPSSAPRATLGDSLANINGLYFGNHSVKEPYNSAGGSSVGQPAPIEHTKNGPQYGAQQAFGAAAAAAAVTKLVATSAELVAANETNVPV